MNGLGLPAASGVRGFRTLIQLVSGLGFMVRSPRVWAGVGVCVCVIFSRRLLFWALVEALGYQPALCEAVAGLFEKEETVQSLWEAAQCYTNYPIDSLVRWEGGFESHGSWGVHQRVFFKQGRIRCLRCISNVHRVARGFGRHSEQYSYDDCLHDSEGLSWSSHDVSKAG